MSGFSAVLRFGIEDFKKGFRPATVKATGSENRGGENNRKNISNRNMLLITVKV